MSDEKNPKPSGNENRGQRIPDSQQRSQRVELGKAINKGNVPQMLNPSAPPKKK